MIHNINFKTASESARLSICTQLITEQVDKQNNSYCSILLYELVVEKADKGRQECSIFEELEPRGSRIIWHPFSVVFMVRNVHGGNPGIFWILPLRSQLTVATMLTFMLRTICI